MLDVSPSYLYFCASANTAFLPNEVPLLHQQQHTSGWLHHLFCKFLSLLSCHYGGQCREHTSQVYGSS